jgi:hypothetical protein
VEQNVKRLRKPEGVAQPGEVNLVLVAVLVLHVVGERNPTGVRFAEEPNSGLEAVSKGCSLNLRVELSGLEIQGKSPRESAARSLLSERFFGIVSGVH